MKRLFDIVIVLFLLGLLCLPFLIIAVLIKIGSRGPILYWSDRVGVNNTIIKMPKFRTMVVDTPPIPTHLLENADSWVTGIGSVLRKYSLDELPQLWSILRGDMSFVGPRPALFNQDDLIALRTKKGIHKLIPGITGWAQINGRDELPIPQKVEYDEFYMNQQSFFLDLKILSLTLLKVLKAQGVKH